MVPNLESVGSISETFFLNADFSGKCSASQFTTVQSYLVQAFFFNHCAATQATAVAGKLSFGEILGLSFAIWLSFYTMSYYFQNSYVVKL